MECEIHIQMRAHKKVQGFDPKNQVNDDNVPDCNRHLSGVRLVHPGTNVHLDPGTAPAQFPLLPWSNSLNEKCINKTPRPQGPMRILAPCSAD